MNDTAIHITHSIFSFKVAEDSNFFVVFIERGKGGGWLLTFYLTNFQLKLLLSVEYQSTIQMCIQESFKFSLVKVNIL